MRRALTDAVGRVIVNRNAEQTGASVGQVVVYPGEDGYWVVECPSLPGRVSQGKTHEEAIINIREAIKEYVAGLEEDELPVPGDRFEALLVAVWASCRGCPAVRAFARCSRLDSSPRDRRAATSFCAGPSRSRRSWSLKQGTRPRCPPRNHQTARADRRSVSRFALGVPHPDAGKRQPCCRSPKAWALVPRLLSFA
jgi:predicted RNase H-like HicB family nuclease